jgi:hypothetical protein
MKRNTIIALLLVVILAAILTNPNAEQHRFAVSSKLNEKITELNDRIKPKKKFWKVVKEIGSVLTSGYLQQKVNEMIVTDNYHLCSFTKVKLKRREVIVGFGAFGNVWLFTDSLDSIDPEDLVE